MKVFQNGTLKNVLLLYCGIYTFATILSSIMYLANGVYEDPGGNWHEIDRAIIVLIGVLAFALCTYLKTGRKWLNIVIAYVPTLLMAFGYVWMSGLREPLAKSAYQDIFINYTGMFIVICVVSITFDAIQKKRKG